MELSAYRNKKTGQTIIIIPKGLADMYEITDKTKIFLEPKNKKKEEFILKIQNR